MRFPASLARKRRLRFNYYRTDSFVKKSRLISLVPLARRFSIFSDTRFLGWLGSARRYFFEPRLRFSRFQFNLVAIFFITVGLVGGTYLTLSELWPRIFAADSPWSQTDWSGGEGQTAWSDPTKFNSSSNVTTSTTGQLTLSQTEKFTNTGFEADLSGWSAGSRPDMIPGLKAWFAADQIAGLSDGDPVGTWPDLSGNAHDAVGADAARPTYKTNIVNGLPIVRGDGNDVLYTDHLDSNIGTIFIVMGNLSPNGYQSPMCFKTNTGGYNWKRAYVMAGDTIHLYGGDANDIFTAPLAYYIDGVAGYSLGDAGYHVVTLLGDVPVAVPEEAAVMSSVVNNWLIGDVGEAIIYSSVLSNTDRNNLETYLSDKYNISVSSPTLTATRDTVTTYNSSAGSAKLDVANTVISANFTQTVDVGDTDDYNLEAFAYTDGSAVTDSNLQLFAADSAVSTSYTAVGGGWYKLTGTATGADAQKGYGVQVKGGLLVSDSFADTPATALTAHTPDINTVGGGWKVAFWAGFSISAGGTTADLDSYGNHGGSEIDAGMADAIVESDINSGATPAYAAGISFRGSGGGGGSFDRYFFDWVADGALLRIQKGDDILAQAGFSVSPNTTYRFKVVVVGTSIKAYINDDLKFDITDSALNGTYYGIYQYNGHDTRWDNFSVKVLPENLPSVYIDDISLYSYPSSGALVSSIFDAGFSADWGTLTYGAITPAGTSVAVKIRTSNSSTMEGAPEFSSCSAIGSGSDISSNGCVTDTHRYIQYQVTLSTTDQTTTPTFEDVSIAFSPSDVTPPTTNASVTLMYKSNGGAQLSGNDWTNGSSPYFTWTAGEDNPGGSGLKGYCLYLGTDSNGDPSTAKGLLGTSPVSTAGTTCQFIISSESLDFANASYKGGTWLSTSADPYFLNIKAVDNAGNVFSGDSEQFQFRFDNTPPSNPSFISAPGDFVSTYEVTLTWPTSSPSEASDANSGVAGLQYRISYSGTWYGDLHSGTQDENDLLTDDGVYTTIETPDYDGLGTDDLVEGNNTIYFRTWDVAGNVASAYISAGVKINTNAPSSPQNLSVSPATNTVNSFSFSWDSPVTYVGQASNITYCYTVNTLPGASTCTFTATGATSLSADAFANQPGSNTFYLVAKDEAGNINYAVYAPTTFTANTSAPGIPTNVEIVDASIKETSAWKLALAWEPPADLGAGVASYKVYRSTTATSCSESFGSFSNVATTTGTSFLDSGLTQANHYYCIKACDSANNCSAVSSTATEYPTGRWKVPADLTSGPVASPVTTRRAVVSWTTGRGSDSKVAYGTASGSYFEEEPSIAAQVTSHSITLTNLNPGTTYFYKVKWTDEDGNTGQSSERTFTTQPAPTIKDVAVTSINISSAIVSFTSTSATKVELYYGPTASFGGVAEQETAVTESRYQVQLTGLLDGTKYYYKINPLDTEGAEYEGTILNFTTYPRPRITNVRIQEVSAATSTVDVSWESNTLISSIVTFYPPSAPGQSRDVVELKRVTKHKVRVQGLKPSTDFLFVAKGVDAIGNLAVSDSQKFTTATDTRPPVISNILVETSIQGIGSDAQAQIIISWETDEPATGQLEYGAGAGATYTSKTPEDPSLIFYHLQVITDLSTSEVYHFRILTKDEAGNGATGDDYIVITPERTDSALDLIITNLADTFRFLGGLRGLLGK